MLHLMLIILLGWLALSVFIVVVTGLFIWVGGCSEHAHRPMSLEVQGINDVLAQAIGIDQNSSTNQPSEGSYTGLNGN